MSATTTLPLVTASLILGHLEALTQSPLCYAGRKTVRELLTHHDNDPLQEIGFCGAVVLEGGDERDFCVT